MRLLYGAMTEPVDHKTAPAPKPDLDGALARLQAALTVLEIAAARRREADLAQADLAESLAAMQDDRARLALDLDEVLARARKLEAANDDVTRRLESAGRAIKTILDASSGDAEAV